MTQVVHPMLGAIEVDWGWEPSMRTEGAIAIESVTNAADTIVWYMPGRDYTSIEDLVAETPEYWDRYRDWGDSE